ncbi:MAG: 50S ribosomal protein L32 [bacterium]
MANPKRRFSNSRTAKRHSQWKLPSPSISLCPQCKHPKLPHRVCTNCGFYNNSLVLSMAKKEFKKERKEKKRREIEGTKEEEEKKE